MNLENEIINYMDKVVEDHPEIPSYILASQIVKKSIAIRYTQ